MENLLRSIYETFEGREETLGILVLEKKKTNSPLTEQFDALIIIIVKNDANMDSPCNVEHYSIEKNSIAVNIISENKFLKWLPSGNFRRNLLWVINGQIVFDRDGYLENLKNNLFENPIETRKKKIAMEFAELIRSCSIGKELYDGKQYLDAFNQMVQSLHHLARLSVLEHGFYPEITVWNQVKKIEPEVYALYLELVESTELIEKRVELLLLAIEFAISSRARIGSSYLIEIMKSKEDAWTISELVNEPKLKELAKDLGLLLQYLYAKNIVQIETKEIEGPGIYQMQYKVR
ncbi:nucleotidyltransferase-like protein [Schinkia azotoformans]|uniref:nucleotidyltransferase-like protein n=1 Tax=Schinkia azotoformans TaxID=1454 RepID=UPI002E22ABD9|nr:nucleotidyltransferase-like protein [Schinkia azotoformans]